MSWTTTIGDIETALSGLSDGAHKEMGEGLLKEFQAKLAEYDRESKNSPQPSPSAEYITWRDVTVPAFLAELRALADQYDGRGTDPMETNPRKEHSRLKERLKSEGLRQYGDESSLLYRGAGAAFPKQPEQYTGPNQSRTVRNLLSKLERLDEEAQLWLALVA